MQLSVRASIFLLLLVTNVPFLQPICNTHFLSLSEWITVIALALVPAIIAGLIELIFAFRLWSLLREYETTFVSGA